MNRPETERALLASLKHVTTWEDMYEWFDNQVRACVQIGHPAVVFGALFFMHSFLQAMRELPEEGNIEALKERMIRVLVYEQREKFSVDVGLFVGPPPHARAGELCAGDLRNPDVVYAQSGREELEELAHLCSSGAE